MAGTITTSTIQNDTSSPPTFRNNSVEIGTLCRAWVNFNGTGTVAIGASFNVSSITDNGTGNYTINFTTAMPDTNYAFAGAGTFAEDGLNTQIPLIGTPRTTNVVNTTSLRIITNLNDAVSYDTFRVTVAVFR